MERLFSLTITLEQYNTIKTALYIERERNLNNDFAIKLIDDAIAVVSNAKVIN